MHAHVMRNCNQGPIKGTCEYATVYKPSELYCGQQASRGYSSEMCAVGEAKLANHGGSGSGESPESLSSGLLVME